MTDLFAMTRAESHDCILVIPRDMRELVRDALNRTANFRDSVDNYIRRMDGREPAVGRAQDTAALRALAEELKR